ncbi:hypothetical protein BRD56_09265 [Thermoplasmatales archaeon SW_10_69_26]|nr:MAG: hypothetical protein BRD56_09265 [Thermoplasmatales archaeon SW_10_69_26]
MNQETTWHVAVTLACALALLATPLAGAASASPYVTDQQAKLTPDAIGEDDRFAQDIAVDGDRLALGNTNAGDGEVYVYDRSGDQPRLVDTITAPDGFANVGEALVYQHTADGWTHHATLSSTDPGSIERFGSALALEDGTLAVAEPEDAPDGYDSNGAVHVYEAASDGWAHQTKLTPPNDPDKERLGYEITLEDGFLYAGAPEDETNAGTERTYAGAIYVYEDGKTGWANQQTITAPEDSDAEQFGRALAVDGDQMIVGAPGPQASVCCSPLPSSQDGDAFAYALQAGGWQHQADLEPAVSAHGSVGFSVALDDGTAYVASPAETATVVAHDGQLLATAPGADTNAHNAGAVYLFGDPTSDDGSEDSQTTSPCTSPADGVEACNYDDDPQPEYVETTGEIEGVGSAEVSYFGQEYTGWMFHVAHVQVAPDDDLPGGENDLEASFLCQGPPTDGPPCNEADAQVLYREEPGTAPPLRVDAECNWLSVNEGSLCGRARASGTANVADVGADASATCGGFFSPCPTLLRVLASLQTPAGGQEVGAVTSGGAASVCLDGLAEAGCQSAP